jgi:RNA polymerase sigma factor (sigma-70 family)
VAKHIQKFKRDHALGSFRGWLRNIIRWRIADQFEQRNQLPVKKDPLPNEDVPDLEQLPDPTSSELADLWDAEWRSNLFEAAVQRVKRRVKEEHYLMFDLYVIGRWPVRKVAHRLGVSVGQVYLNKHRISALIRKEIRALEKRPI